MARHGENIYRRKDGRYEGRYVIGRNPNGTTRFGYIYGRRYGDVRDELLRRKASLLENRGDARGRMTLRAWIERWLRCEVQCCVKPSTFQTYSTQYRKHIAPSIGAMEIGAISPGDVQAFLAEKREGSLAASTVNGIYRLLNAALNAAVEEGVLRRNPCRKVRLIRSEWREQRVLSRQEQEGLRRAAGSPAELPALLGLYAGMRLGEVCALRWTDIDWEGGTLSVRRTVQRISSAAGQDGRRTRLAVGAPKTNRSQRVLPVPEFILALLRELRADASSEYVFGEAASPAEPRTMQRRFKRLTDKLQLTGVHFHTLRHTFATRMLELGIDAKTVSVLLGHSSTRTTLDVYVHSPLERQRFAVERLVAQS